MKQIDISNLVKFIIVFPLLLVSEGCFSYTPKPPSIPPGINAQLPSYVNRSQNDWPDSNDYDVSALFYIDYIVQYAEKSHVGAISEWYINKLNKISTLEGQFDEEEISFLCFVGYAKPGAWIQFTPIPYQYKRRMVLQIGLKTDKLPYKIVSLQQRSWLAPYGKLVKPEQADNFKDIVNTVCSHYNIDQIKFRESWELWLKNNAIYSDLLASYEDVKRMEEEKIRRRNNASLPGIGNFEIVDENEEIYVIRVHLIDKKEEHLIINKTTLEVGPLPVPKNN